MILVLCEGPDEKAMIDLLLDYDKLSFTRDDLLGRVPYVARQLNYSVVESEILHYGNEIFIYRIGDTQTDILKIPKKLRTFVAEKRIKKYCTKPEFEYLLIISENMIGKYKGKEKPSDFAKKNIIYNGKHYDKSTKFIKEYFSGDRINLLLESLKEYKRIKSHKSDELFLADLLK